MLVFKHSFHFHIQMFIAPDVFCRVLTKQKEPDGPPYSILYTS